MYKIIDGKMISTQIKDECRERVAKYNRLLSIEEELGENALFGGLSAFGKLLVK